MHHIGRAVLGSVTCVEVMKRTRCRHCNNIEWEWPPESDMGLEPPPQEPLFSCPDVPHLELVSVASQESTASVTEVEVQSFMLKLHPLKTLLRALLNPSNKALKQLKHS